LFLGSAETIGGFTDLFAPVSAKSRLFRRTGSSLRPEPLEFPPSFSAAPSNGREARPAANPPLSLQSLADQLVLQRYAPPTVLVNAAGIFGPIALIADVDAREWVRTVEVDAIAPFLTVRSFLSGMLDAGWGRIVKTTSAASLHPPGALNSAYGTAKVALNQLTRHLAAEIAGSGVTANVIHPGDVRTDMWADIRDKVAELGPIAEGYRSWVEWVDETGGDPPHKAVDLVLRLTSDAGGAINGRFCWIDDPLQPPIASWDEPSDERPWVK